MAKPAAGLYAHKSRGQFRRPITGSSAAHVTLPTTLALMNTAIRTRRERNRIGAMQAKPASRHIPPAPSLNLNSAAHHRASILYAHKPIRTANPSRVYTKTIEIRIHPGKIHLRLKRGGEDWQLKSSR
jgi:hypothetical protein